MAESNPNPSATPNPAPADVDPQASRQSPPVGRRRGGWVAVLRTIGIVTVVLVVLAGAGLGGAEYYTARPDFCGTCHVMEPYYKSWSHDLHGRKLGVRCVDCHYAPGERFTFHAKFKGLSQVASYFSGRYGAARPRAHVSDASCLASNCHGDGAYLTKVLPIGEPRTEQRIVSGTPVDVQRAPTVQFVHEKHLRVEAKRAETDQRYEELEAKLRGALPAEAFAELHQVAVSIEPAEQRRETMKRLLAEAQPPELLADALELMDLRHRQTRLRQLAGLTCAACHMFDASTNQHLTVSRVTCYTCHFAHEEFNRRTSECLRCHEPPTREVLVHTQATATSPGPVFMDHRDIVARGIECASCHLDVVQGDASVSVRECAHCHDQARYLEGFAARTLDQVERYHREHVAEQRARCEDCHRTVAHRLIDPTQVATSAGFLEPVLNNCQHCHPNHHAEQVYLLMGTGAAGVERPMPNPMFGSRLNCRACHIQPGEDFKGDPLIKATQEACVGCHGSDYERLFSQWLGEIDSYVRESEAVRQRIEQRLEELRAIGRQPPEAVRALLSQADQNLHLVRIGNGIHNKHYALYLLDTLRVKLDEVARLLADERRTEDQPSP